jgi:hypothetical protein
MSLIVKIMSAEDLADDNTQKSFQLLTGVKFVEFHRRPGAPVASIVFSDEPEASEFCLKGNVYVMNESGKTIGSFGVAVPEPLADTNCGSDPPRPDEEILGWVSYPTAALIRRAARAANIPALLEILNRGQVAIDA